MVDAKAKSATVSNKSQVFCRVRPAVYDGGGHDMNGQAVAKSLDGWTDGSVTINSAYMFSKGEKCYKFPSRVFSPECPQSDVFSYLQPFSDAFME